jgi:DNA mismatch repair protein MutS
MRQTEARPPSTSHDAARIEPMSLTPMMQQYQQAKAACGDALLLFRMGDFYELFYDDARTAARVLGLTLTSRDKGDNPVPMAGFPYHQLDAYLRKLIAAGYRAAVCEQVEDPRQAKGLVRREVTRVVTAGTLTDEALLDPKQGNYLAAVWMPAAGRQRPVPDDEARCGLAWIELSAAEFAAAVIPCHALADELARIAPSEVLLAEGHTALRRHIPQQACVTLRPDWAFDPLTAQAALQRQFGTASLQGFGFELPDDAPAIGAAGAVLDYLHETHRAPLVHLQRLVAWRPGQVLQIDEASRRSLELTRTLREGRREGSLLDVLDQTTTSMGARLLAHYLATPLAQCDAIRQRLQAVGELVDQATLRDAVRRQLSAMYDLQRLVARAVTARATPRDLGAIRRTLGQLPELKALLAGCRSALLQAVEAELDPCAELHEQLAAALQDECPMGLRDGGIIRSGYHAELDSLRELASGGKQWIAAYQQREIERTGIPSLKVGYNRVFGYYLEVTHAQAGKVPSDYVRKQTLKNAERYITPQLKEYEDRVLQADAQAKDLEYELFVGLRDATAAAAPRLQATAHAVAQLDVLAALAHLAAQRGYCCPVLVEHPELHIEQGRHPVLDALQPQGTFVPNDTHLGGDEGRILLITGPNMAGKSTYIRQVALITLLAHLGSFVPARRAVIGRCDRIFARVGASDELARGQSTFMVEMTETARILNTATPHSLVILDEIGRGTSTYDGISLAHSVVEDLHDRVGCRTLFATHYHELTDLADVLPAVRNLNVAVREWNDEVVFLHQIVPGAADRSYGLHVARLAGVPRQVIQRAEEILHQLEARHLDSPADNQARDGAPRRRRSRTPSRVRPGEAPDAASAWMQLTLFGEHPLLERIRQLDLHNLTPLQALALLHQWQEELAAEHSADARR